MNPGKQFEKDIKDSVPKGVYYLRLHDSAIGFDKEHSTQRFALKSPYDAVLCRNGQMICMELKSTKERSISFDGASPMIKPEQLIALHNASEVGGATAGLILNFRAHEKTFWMDIGVFEEFQRVTTKKSISVDDAENYGRRIPSRRLRVHNRYDLSVLWD